MQLNILTHPLEGNYGGMLQAYALFHTCERMGLSPRLYVKNRDSREVYWRRIVRKLRNLACYLRLCIGRADKSYPVIYDLRAARARVFERTFFRTVLDRDCPPGSLFIVGSDQVWRRSYDQYVGGVLYFFLDFLAKKERCNSIAYAASFGSDKWEGSSEETEKCRKFLRQFKAVSVRESSGVRLCSEVFGVEAVQMPDPTLLAELGAYERVIDSEKTYLPGSAFFASYVLDDSPEMTVLLDDVELSMSLYHQRLMPKSTAKRRRDRFYCTVAQWLRYMRDCKAVVTDSFHGCVFSIIYNKPFVCLGNEGRGMARFDTLFKTFGLEDRLVLSREPGEVLRVLHTPIDWERVNAIHESERQRGLDFLRNNLYDDASLGLHE